MSDVQFSMLELEPIRVAARTRLGATVASTVTLKEQRDWITDDLLCGLEAIVYGVKRTARSSLTVRVPASWWQHFKAEAIKWGNPFFRPEKVRYTTIERTVQDTDLEWWPKADFAVPKEWGRPVRVAVGSEHPWLNSGT